MTISELSQLLTAMAAIGAVAMSWRNYYKLKIIRVEMDGRLDQLLTVSKLVAHAEGVQQERKDEAKRIAALAAIATLEASPEG